MKRSNIMTLQIRNILFVLCVLGRLHACKSYGTISQHRVRIDLGVEET